MYITKSTGIYTIIYNIANNIVIFYVSLYNKFAILPLADAHLAGSLIANNLWITISNKPF